jgi:hypothetical protein
VELLKIFIHQEPIDISKRMLDIYIYIYIKGVSANAIVTIYFTPLKTHRYFPLCGGHENCYNIWNVPKGPYFVKVFFGAVA